MFGRDWVDQLLNSMEGTWVQDTGSWFAMKAFGWISLRPELSQITREREAFSI